MDIDLKCKIDKNSLLKWQTKVESTACKALSALGNFVESEE